MTSRMCLLCVLFVLSGLVLSFQQLAGAGKALPDSDDSFELNRLFSEGNKAFRNADYPKALGSYNQGLELARKSNRGKKTGMFLANIGMVHQRLGNYEKALGCLDEAMGFLKESGNRKWEAITLCRAGRVYLDLGRHEKALQYYQQALKIHREDGHRGREGATLHNIGHAYQKLGQYEKALEYYQEAIPILRGFRKQRAEGNVLNSMGKAYQKLGKHEKALKCSQEALSIHKDVKDPWGEASDLINIGREYRSLDQNESAKQALNEALRISLQIGAPDRVWQAHWNLAEIEAKEGAGEEALYHYEQALDTIESLRAGLSEEETQTSFMKDKLFVYDRCIQLLQTLHKKNPSKGYDRKSLEIFERKQGRVFLEQMGKSGARQFAGLPDALVARETALESRLENLQTDTTDESTDLSEEQEFDQMTSIVGSIQQVRAAQKALQEEIRVNYPDYYALKYPKPATLPELQQQVLRPGELILVYGVMDQVTCLWLIGKDHFESLIIEAGREELKERVKTFRKLVLGILDAIVRRHPEYRLNELAKSSMTELMDHGHKLYELLIPERAAGMISKAVTLYVVPTGPLYTLPFEALTPAKGTDVKGAGFLLEQHPVAYISSASLLKILREAEARRKEKPKNLLVAFANPVYGEKADSSEQRAATKPSEKRGTTRSASTIAGMRAASYRDILGGSFPELPDTEGEVKEIKAILGASDQSRPLQLRDAASRSNVLHLNEQGRLHDYRFVVFACHGVLPGEVDQVQQPALVLSHPDPRSGGEGFLTMADVFGLKLNADLVTLSACNTGRGEGHRGEGAMGLTRAFMYAGTPAISVTLWSIDSRSATLLSTGLYRNIKDGKGRAEALRDAKLRMIQGEEGDLYRHPFYWAPLVIFGDG